MTRNQRLPAPYNPARRSVPGWWRRFIWIKGTRYGVWSTAAHIRRRNRKRSEQA